MSLLTEFKSFYRRRLQIPVGPADLVLDVGSGDKPHWRADVLLDWFPTEADGAQRSGSAAAKISRPLFAGDAAHMPFADRAFDYVICSHLLEHVVDPAGVIAELMRVAKAGYIEVPEASSAKIVDFPTHLWFCRLIDGVLDFEPKTAPDFDPEIASYLERSGLEHDIERVLNSHFDERVIALRWDGEIPHSVRGPVDPAMLASAANASVVHQGKTALVASLFTNAAALVDRRHRRVVTWNEVVRPDFQQAVDHELVARMYRVDDIVAAG